LKKFFSGIKYNKNPIWKEEYVTEYETQQKNLPNTLLTIKIKNSKSKKTIGEFNINLYEICNAPTHFDFKLGKNYRIYMDI
jgi:hypothetical protein